MIRHIVLMRFGPTIDDAAIDSIAAGLRALPDQVPTIRSFACGPDLRLAEGSWDFAVVADFDDADGWRVYDEDEEHNRVRRELIAPHLVDRASVRFEL